MVDKLMQKDVSRFTQTKESIPEEFRKKIGNRLYGCDSCQTICPKIKGLIFIFMKKWSLKLKLLSLY